MRLHVIGHKGVVGNATYELFKRLGYNITGSDKEEEVPKADIYFICVPEGNVEEVVDLLPFCWFIAVRSSVLPGTCKYLQRDTSNHISHNPEFLRECIAIQDEFSPARVVIGECCKEHGDILEDLYKPLRVPIARTDPTTSELVKMASNNYLSMVVSYWNTIEEIGKRVGVSGHQVGMIAAMDPRIGPYGARLHNKFGGRCLPKDIRNLIEFSKSVGYDPALLKAIEEVNNSL